MNKIQEVKKKLGEYRENWFVCADLHKTAVDALTVITEQESEIDRLNSEMEAMKAAFEEEQQKAARVFCEKVKLTVENKKLEEALDKATADALSELKANINIKTDFKNLLEENSKLAEQVAKEKSKNGDLVIKLAELQRKASSFVLDPNKVEKVVFDRCPV